MAASDTNLKLRPIDAFIKYVLDVKPYHTKLLEVIERYNFSEEMLVTFAETSFTNITYINTPLCRPVGWGLIYDTCGFSNDNCCDLFQCIGGYGIIFDNSDLIATHNIIDVDMVEDKIVLDGNWMYDRRFEIIQINQNTMKVRGDRTSELATHKLFIIAPFNVHTLIGHTADTITVAGNKVTELLGKREFRVTGSRGIDGMYGVRSAVFDEATDTTTITLAGNAVLASTSIDNAYVETETNPTNQGFYTLDTVQFDGINTNLTIKNQNFPVDTTVNCGSLQIRTALTAPRRVWLRSNDIGPLAAPAESGGDVPPDPSFMPTPTADPSSTPTPSANPTPTPAPAPTLVADMIEYRIADSYYDVTNDKTHVIFAEFIGRLEGNFAPTQMLMYGYLTTAGFDNDEECDRPKPTNIHTLFGEKLEIRPVASPIVYFAMLVGEQDIPVINYEE